MITVLTGDNNFEMNRALEGLVQGFAGEATRADGSELSFERLIELVSSLSLFAEKRLVVIRDLASNKPVWTALGDQLDRISEDVHLVLVEQSADKRTATYKRLQKAGSVQTFTAWTERDTSKAENWVIEQAKQLGSKLDKKSAQLLVERVGVDQWQLYHALEKLSVLEVITPDIVSEVIEETPTENVFNLLESALRGDAHKVTAMVRTLQRTQDPFMTFGLLSGQVFQLAALAVANKPANEVASDIGAHPFALSKLAPYAKRLGKGGSKKIVTIFADTDTAMKSTVADPWLLIEKALIKVCDIK